MSTEITIEGQPEWMFIGQNIPREITINGHSLYVYKHAYVACWWCDFAEWLGGTDGDLVRVLWAVRDHVGYLGDQDGLELLAGLTKDVMAGLSAMREQAALT